MNNSTPILCHPSAVAPRVPSPWRILRALWTRIRTADGPTMENEIMDEELTRAHLELTACATESTALEKLIARLRQHWKDFMADGALDPREQRILAADQRALATQSRQHTEHLESLR